MGLKPAEFINNGMNQNASRRRHEQSETPGVARMLSPKEPLMAKMTKNQLIDAIAEATQISKGDVKSVVEQMATVGYKELNEAGEFVIPGFVKMSVVHKPATEARSGINPFTKEPMEFAAKPASKSVKASPLKVVKDAV
jgi:DNA-binding protein HU-beta